jgi:hypothetical protein
MRVPAVNRCALSRIRVTMSRFGDSHGSTPINRGGRQNGQFVNRVFFVVPKQ